MVFVFQVLFLATAIWTFQKLENPLYSMLIHVVPMILVGLLVGAGLFDVLIGGAILAALSYGYFLLLSYVPYGTPYYATMVVGAVIFVAVI